MLSRRDTIEAQSKLCATKRKNRAMNRLLRHQKAALFIPSEMEHFEAHEKCYLKEARAMLEGKDVSGKNKCVKLPGD